MSKILTLLAIVYAFCALWFYQSTPLGQEVLLDARENWTLAQGFLNGDSSVAYRAPLYAGFLSLLMRLGLSESLTLIVAQGANVFFHLLAAFFIGMSARLIWHKRSAGYLAGLLYAAYPVALYLSFDLLDTALANCLAALGLYFLLLGKYRHHASLRSGFVALVGFSLAALTRSHFWVWVGFGLFFLLRESAYRRARWSSLWGGILAMALIVGGFMSLERARTGQWELLPSQASYNLYAANEAGSVGEGFIQKVDFYNMPNGVNPARLQSEYLYRKANPKSGESVSEAQINDYWRDLFWQELASNPQKKLSLYAKKLYSMFHLHEGYNNKTYTYQKASSPYLRFNPLNFIWVSVLVWVTCLFAKPFPREAKYLLGLTLVYAMAAAVFYASDRFRLPMVMPLAIVAGGFLLAIHQMVLRFKVAPWAAVFSVLWRTVLVVCWGLAFSAPLLNVGKYKTSEADMMMQAQASLNQNANAAAINLSRKLIDAGYSKQSATSILLKANYNQLISGEVTPTSLAWFFKQERMFHHLQSVSADLEYVWGYYNWILDGDRACWHNILAEATPGSSLTLAQANALGAVVATNALYPNEIALLQSLEPRPVIVEVALASVGEHTSLAKLRHTLGQDEAKTTIDSYRKLFDRQHFIGLNGNNAH